MTRYCVDASALIDSWNETYMPAVFPGLWEQLARHKESLTIIRPIWDEMGDVPPKKTNPSEKQREQNDLQCWLIDNGVADVVVPMSSEWDRASLELEGKYEIAPNTKGASKNDIRLIAHARAVGGCVVTAESKQPYDPERKLYNYKIPAICIQEKVECVKFVQMVKSLGIVLK